MNPSEQPEFAKSSETEELEVRPGDEAVEEFPATVTDIRVDGAEEEPVELEFGSPEERYEVIELLGEGGMGEVFEARDRLFGRRVALKFVKPTASRLTFFREARTSGLLTHPNIPPVYDIGVDPAGRPFYAMQLIRGRNLAEILKERKAHPDRWSLPRMLTLFQSLCSALGYAHERGLVHLDVKPGNVMVGELQQLYVVDWGLSASENEEVRETRGTPAFMSPEQASASRSLGSASDVFSAGCVLYEIATRQRCFSGRTRSEVLEKVRAAAYDRSDGWLEVPSELRDVISSSLDPDPSARPSASALNDQIQEYLDGTRERERLREEAEEALRRAEEALRDRERWVGRRNERENLASSLRPPTWVSGEARTEFWEAEDA
ncbi:MAG: serine/threonine-protein kinase, partial [Planctomycetota bacterium]